MKNKNNNILNFKKYIIGRTQTKLNIIIIILYYFASIHKKQGVMRFCTMTIPINCAWSTKNPINELNFNARQTDNHLYTVWIMFVKNKKAVGSCGEFPSLEVLQRYLSSSTQWKWNPLISKESNTFRQTESQELAVAISYRCW